MTDDPVVLLREAADKVRLELIDILACGDGQNWPDFWTNPEQRQIGEQMYGAMADELLASSWLDEVVRLRAENEQLRRVSVTVTDTALVLHHNGPGNVSTLKYAIPEDSLYKAVQWAQFAKQRGPQLPISYPLPSDLGCSSECSDELGHRFAEGCELVPLHARDDSYVALGGSDD